MKKDDMILVQEVNFASDFSLLLIWKNTLLYEMKFARHLH